MKVDLSNKKVRLILENVEHDRPYEESVKVDKIMDFRITPVPPLEETHPVERTYFKQYVRHKRDDFTGKVSTERLEVAIPKDVQEVLDFIGDEERERLNDEIKSRGDEIRKLDNEILGYKIDIQDIELAGFFIRLKWLFTGVKL